DRDSCVDKSKCSKYGYYGQCDKCCKKAGDRAGNCVYFKCKCNQ
uniref:Potassium channel toxin gamma-KTx 4.6 n=1 Tax=Centruroides limpidus TaxID=6876 RepID=KGX46_CENLI